MAGTPEQQQELIKSTYKEITLLLGLIKKAEKLSNDVIGSQVVRVLTEELKAQHEFIAEIVNT